MGLFEYAAPVGTDDQPTEQRILDSFNERDWERLMPHVDHITFNAGDTLFKTGDVDRSLLILLEGNVAVIQTMDDDAPPLANLSAGSVIGEIAFFDGAPRSANVLATSGGKALHISRDKFDYLSAWEPDLARTILMDLGSVLAARLRGTTQALNQAILT